jgi:hypothetical protein
MTWFYNDKEFLSEDIENNIGFVYLILNTENQKMYVGKKKFFSIKRLSKKRKRIKIESDWKNYFGSCKELQEDVEILGKDKFKRVILHLCISKGILNYFELKEQIIREVLFRDDYYNNYIGSRIHRNHVNKKTSCS